MHQELEYEDWADDDLDTMADSEDLLEAEAIDDFEEGFIRGYLAA